MLVTDPVREGGARPKTDPVTDGAGLYLAGLPHAGVEHGGLARDEGLRGLDIGLGGHVGIEGTVLGQRLDVVVQGQEVRVVVAGLAGQDGGVHLLVAEPVQHSEEGPDAE